MMTCSVCYPACPEKGERLKAEAMDLLETHRAGPGLRPDRRQPGTLGEQLAAIGAFLAADERRRRFFRDEAWQSARSLALAHCGSAWAYDLGAISKATV